MTEIGELLLRARLDADSFEAWVSAGWIAPRRGAEPGYTEADLARACLIRDLRESLGVNDEGIAVVLGLLDQVHGLRQALRHVATCLQDLPEPLRQEILGRLGALRGPGP